MTILFCKTKSVVISTIALLALVACGRPTVQTNPAPATNAPINTAPTANPNQSASVDDAAERVEDVIDNNPSLKAFDLDVDDEGNSIALTGRVQNEAQRTLAENVAKEAAPGFSIVNRITF